MVQFAARFAERFACMSVCQICARLQLLYRFHRLWRFVESITYAGSTRTSLSIPPASIRRRPSGYGELHWQPTRRHALAFAAVPKADARRSPPRRTEAGCTYYVYILRSSVNRNQTYVGSTSDLKKRLGEHTSGKTIHTNKFRPWKLEAYVAFPRKDLADKFERCLKTGSGRAFPSRHR
jgi:putative endonuclease